MDFKESFSKKKKNRKKAREKLSDKIEGKIEKNPQWKIVIPSEILQKVSRSIYRFENPLLVYVRHQPPQSTVQWMKSFDFYSTFKNENQTRRKILLKLSFCKKEKVENLNIWKQLILLKKSEDFFLKQEIFNCEFFFFFAIIKSKTIFCQHTNVSPIH